MSTSLPDSSENTLDAPASPLVTPPWTHTITGGPWPERVGLRCRVVDDPGTGTYPWDKPHKNERVVFVENDPHDGKVYSFGPGLTDDERGWTCVISRHSLTIGHAGAPSVTSEQAGQK